MRKLLALCLTVCLVFTGCGNSQPNIDINTEQLETYCSQIFNPVVNKYFQENSEELLKFHSESAADYIAASRKSIESEKTHVFELNAFSYQAEYQTGVVSQTDDNYRLTAYLQVTQSEVADMLPLNMVIDLTWNSKSESISALEVEVYA